ncbi:glycosyltransferase, partial [Kineococcus glutinatus]|uniref:glycosyltransferase n=1 Tax=Kineococcus glutinatus TaxID=1070872 RepID=UPI0031EFFEBF
MDRPLVVLQSFRAPRPTTNPYLSLLLRSLPPDVRARTFSWRHALLGRYDVLHVHWPEVLLRGSTPARTAARRAAFAVLLARLALGGPALVRTVHNPAPHERGGPLERLLLAAADRATDLTVHLTPATAGTVRPAAPAVLVPHGHYRGWYVPPPGVRPVPGRFLHVGLLRPYKDVDGLLAAFRELGGRDGAGGPVELRIAGACPDPALAGRITAAAAADPGVDVLLRHLDDAELAAEVAAAELVVLPYARMQNSGALLLALSLDRPVLVPSNEVTRALAEEVGPGWVHLFTGRLGAADLRRALAAV